MSIKIRSLNNSRNISKYHNYGQTIKKEIDEKAIIIIFYNDGDMDGC